MRAATLGERIRQYRLEADLSQRDLAARVGVRPISAWRWETDRSVPPLRRLEEISEALGISVAKLFQSLDESI